MKARHGMLLGKFMPPHFGHRYLVEFAANVVERLTVVVGTLAREPIAGDLRFAWMKSLFPRQNVVHLQKELPQEPAEHPCFWDLWYEALMEIMPAKPDVVFASEPYGRKLAEIFDARFMPVDMQRRVMPVSGTRVREDPYGHWRYLPDCVKAHYRKRVCVFGPESTGKTTLAEALARHYHTIAVPEYAREYLERQDGELNESDLTVIARGQWAAEQALSNHAGPVLICDTDVLTTSVWAQTLYGRCDPWIEQQARAQQYDMYLLTDVDTPWEPDPVRYLPDRRESFKQHCIDALQRLGRPYRLLRGHHEKRFTEACVLIDGLLKS